MFLVTWSGPSNLKENDNFILPINRSVKKHKQKGEGEFWRIMRKKKELARVEINSARAHKKKKKLSP